MRVSKIEPCIDCGKRLPRKELNRARRCSDCAMAAVRDSMAQMHQKSGPYYEKWKENLRAAASRL
ncbi:hypothetical protein ES708_12284 [subsurface metagenome]